ncbi:MAG: DUF4129 domain-containing protein [Anaerolineaceae bacterium]|nr:DUF4129 domain-containing protein [Anaerolineaceae bacterium]
MIFQKRNLALFYTILSIICLMILGLSLPELQFLPGLPIPGTDSSPANNPTTVPETSIYRISSQWIFQIGLAVGSILLFILIITALLKKVNFKQVSLLVGTLAIFFALSSLLPQLSPNQPGTFPVDTTLPEHPQSEYQVAPIGDPPVSLFIWVKVGLVLASMMLLGWLVAHAFRRNQKDNKLAAETESAIQAITSGGNLGGVIIKCYVNMEKVVSQERGIDRDQSMTPHEFETHLTNKGIPTVPIRRLTTLFEKARYGKQCLTEQDELDALRSLSAIWDVCQLGRGRGQ